MASRWPQRSSSTLSLPANAAEITDPATESTATTLDTVTVARARAQARSVRESAAPIDVLLSQDIRAANATNLLDVLNTLLPSFNLPIQPSLSTKQARI